MVVGDAGPGAGDKSEMQQRVEKRADGFFQTLQKFDEQLNKDFAKYEWLAPVSIISEVTGVTRTKIMAIGGFMIAYACTIGFGRIISNMVGFLYPAYRSYKAVKTEDKDDDTQWLIYWVVYAFFTVGDGMFGYFFSWLPLYFFIKIGFLIWCMHPRTKGATFILNNVIIPFLEKYEQHIDEAGIRLSQVFKRGAAGAKGPLDNLLVSGMQQSMSFYANAQASKFAKEAGERSMSPEYRQGEGIPDDERLHAE